MQKRAVFAKKSDNRAQDLREMRQTHTPKQNKRKAWLLALLIGVALIAVYGITIAAGQPAFPVDLIWVTPAQKTVIIKEGQGASQIARTLFTAHVINNEKTFMTYATQKNKQANIQPGAYRFEGVMTCEEVLDLIISGPNSDDGKLTVPEGMSVKETARLAHDHLGIDEQTFMSEASASKFIKAFPFLEGVNDDSLEGYLMGATYYFDPSDVTAHEVIERMLTKYQQSVKGIDMSAAIANINRTYGLNLNSYDIIKVASIAEKEGVQDDDYPQITSVFYNRLRDGWNLCSDATLAYALGRNVSADDLKQQNPYNTYLNSGLPPTPLCSPSLTCIKAALFPPATDKFYFVLAEDKDVSIHAFSRTEQEHQKAVDELIAQRAAATQ